MASLKDIRRRIRATKSMQQIFKAMEMVSAAKLRRAQARAHASRPYARKITEMLDHLAGAAADLENPLFETREVKQSALLVITADRGFAGTYSTNVVRVAEAILRTRPAGSVRLVTLGRKGRDYFRRRGYALHAAHAELPGEANLELARRLTDELVALFLSGEVDRVEVLYTHMVNALVRRVETEVFLPIGAGRKTGSADANFIFEPDAEHLFAELLPRYATAKLYAAMADSFAAEHSARMVAMGAARKNAGELVDSLTLTRNRLRQAAITREIAELVGGAEALK
ncbi:MAG TPA: ATP synthase F1 subunit gamma [Candidatus Acidoferrales bacterium]|nr:ATP synthase F1 subunit gamma [Candidatus Acidoferrales bacterium]